MKPYTKIACLSTICCLSIVACSQPQPSIHLPSAKQDLQTLFSASNLGTLLKENINLNSILAAGPYHNVAVKADGTVVIWGRPYDEDLKKSIYSGNGLTNVKAIATSYSHGIALKKDDTLIAWGNNFYGQAKIPTELQGAKIKAIAAGNSYNLVLKDNGTVAAWGGAEGFMYHTTIELPEEFKQKLTHVKTISAGGISNIALKDDGTLIAWSWEEELQDTPHRILVKEIPFLNGLKDVKMATVVYNASEDFESAFISKKDDTVIMFDFENGACIKWNKDGTPMILNKGTPSDDSDEEELSISNEDLPRFSRPLKDVKQFVRASNYIAALNGDGTVAELQLDGSPGKLKAPEVLKDVVAIATGNYHLTALKSDGSVIAWGEDKGYESLNVPKGLNLFE